MLNKTIFLCTGSYQLQSRSLLVKVSNIALSELRFGPRFGNVDTRILQLRKREEKREREKERERERVCVCVRVCV